MFNKPNSTKKTDFLPLNDAEMVKTRGGLLFTCEEKRSILGFKYTAMVLKDDGNGLWLTVRM